MAALTLSLTLGHIRAYSCGVSTDKPHLSSSGNYSTVCRPVLLLHHAFLHQVLLLTYGNIHVVWHIC